MLSCCVVAAPQTISGWPNNIAPMLAPNDAAVYAQGVRQAAHSRSVMDAIRAMDEYLASAPGVRANVVEQLGN